MISKIRIISTNDVYELKNWPSFKTCYEAHRLPESEGKTILVLPGDFLAPSLLSSIDHGAGMVDCMNVVGFDYVCFGNHEADIAVVDLWQRIRESRFLWLNSNMPEFPQWATKEEDGWQQMKRHEVIDVGNGKKIALLGFLTPQPDLYKEGAFDGAIETTSPILETAIGRSFVFPAGMLLPLCADIYEELKDSVDVIIPLTHQSMFEDRIMAEKTGGRMFPLVIGAHDHIPYDETINGTHIIKVGMDATHMAVCDVEWTGGDMAQPKVSVQTVSVTEYAQDPEVLQVVEHHKSKVQELAEAYLWKIPPHYQGCLSSKGVRSKQTTCGAHLMSAVRRAMLADAAFYQGGGIRRSYDYPKEQTHFSYLDLREELAFEDEMVLIPMKGKEFADTIEYSRRFAGEREFGGFFQCDRGVQACPHTGKITHVGFAPIELEKSYWVAAPVDPLQGLENNVPLMQWVARNGDKIPTHEFTWPGRKNTKAAIVANQVKRVWHHMHSWDKLPKKADGTMGNEEVRTAIRAILGYVPVNDFAFGNVMRWADPYGKGIIDEGRFLRVKLKVMVPHGKDCCVLWYKNLKEDTKLDPEKDIKPLAYAVLLGEKATREDLTENDRKLVDQVVHEMDIDCDGVISRSDVLRWQQDRDMHRRMSH